MSLVGDYGDSSDDSEEEVEGVQVDGPPKQKKRKLPPPDFSGGIDVTIFKPVDEEPEINHTTNFSRHSFVRGYRGNKDKGKGKGKGGKGKGKGGKGKGKGGKQREADGTVRPLASEAAKTAKEEGQLEFSQVVARKDLGVSDEMRDTATQMRKKLTRDSSTADSVEPMVSKEVRKKGNKTQIVTITRRPDAAPANTRRITMRDLFPKEMKRC